MSVLEPTLNHIAEALLNATLRKTQNTRSTVTMAEKDLAYQHARRVVDVIASVLMSDKLRVVTNEEISGLVNFCRNNQTGLVNLKLMESLLEQKAQETYVRDLMRRDKNAFTTRTKSRESIKSLSLFGEPNPQIQSPVPLGRAIPGADIQI